MKPGRMVHYDARCPGCDKPCLVPGCGSPSRCGQTTHTHPVFFSDYLPAEAPVSDEPGAEQ